MFRRLAQQESAPQISGGSSVFPTMRLSHLRVQNGQMTSPIATASALGLYLYGGAEPGADLFARFARLTESLFARLGIAPTYLGLGGDGYPEGFVRYGGRAHKKALAREFDGVVSVSVAANPVGSDEPTFDSFALASLSYTPSVGELLLSLEVNEAWLPFDGEAYAETMGAYITLAPWSFGFGFADASNRQPGFHILSLDPGDLPPDERTRLLTWYAVAPEVRVRKLRDVYALNLLGAGQLGEATRDGGTLRSLITSMGAGDIQPTAGTSLMSWRVPTTSREAVRRQMAEAGAIAGL